ncbi:MAG: D-alanine--D-alanine ligase [Pseudomonadota bacterium]
MDRTHEVSVLHLAGSNSSDFYVSQSISFAEETVIQAGTSNIFGVAYPDGTWRLGSDLENLGSALTLPQFLERLPPIDIVVPYMFCRAGMTAFRSLFEDILKIPVFGPTASSNSISMDKHHTRELVSANGVRVPNGLLLRSKSEADQYAFAFPKIVKPNCEDNSLGLSLVHDEAHLDHALDQAFAYDSEVLIEDYIAGREVRVAVVETEDGIFVPSIKEYLVNEQHPIRHSDDKISFDIHGKALEEPVAGYIATQCPASLDNEVRDELVDFSRKAHLALGCRHYSLFDFRIETATGRAFFLEAGLFWTIGPNSIITQMLTASNINPNETFMSLLQQAIAQDKPAKLGMN